MKIEKNYPLQNLNTFGLEVYAKYFISLSTLDDAIHFFRNHAYRNEQTLILGSGSNILFTTEKFNGLVVKNEIPGIHVVREDEHHFWVKAGGGVVWHDLVESCLKANFGGIENLSLIPGTVGAAPIQNIGAYGVEIKDVFEALEAVEMATGEKKYFHHKDCHFGYRDSVFKHELSGKYFITNIVLKLRKEPVLNTGYGNVREELEKLNKTNPTIRDVSDVIIKIRTSKLPDPAVKGNAGSFFKNPVIPEKKMENLRMKFPQMPQFAQSDGNVKIPAAWLIEQCGLKGHRYNGAVVHHQQPLVLVNENNARGTDLLRLAAIVQEQVRQKFDIDLEPEVRIV